MNNIIIGPCACLGPQYNEPHCACTMKAMSLERSDEYKADNTPEAIALREEQLRVALSKIFEWKE